MQVLQGWQRKIDRSYKARVQRAALAVAFVGMLMAFLMLLRSPYQRATLNMVVLAPRVANAGDHESPSLVKVKGPALEAIDVDIASLLCEASGRQLEQCLQARLPQSHMRLEGRQLKQQSQSLTTELMRSLDPQSTLIVYVSGVLSLENKQLAICDRGHAAMHGGGELSLLPLVDQLQKSSCRRIMLCLDLVAPSHAAPAVMAAPLLVEQLSESLEQALAIHTGRTPLAVCIQLNSSEEVMRAGGKATPLAKSLLTALTDEALDRQFDIARFKQRVGSLAQQQASLAKPMWLTSLHWPAVSEKITLPKVLDKLNDNLAGDKQALALVDNAQPDSPPSPSLSQADFDKIASEQPQGLVQLPDAQLWACGRAALESLGRVELNNQRPVVSDWLSLPESLSYRQRYPFTYAWLQYVWRDLESARELSTDQPPAHCLRAFVQVLVNLNRAQTSLYDLDSPYTPEQRVDRRSWGLRSNTAAGNQAANSLIADGITSRLNSISSPSIDRANDCLAQLTQAIDRATELADFQTALEKIDVDESQRYVEFDQCRALCDAGLAWTTLQPVLRLQLLSVRAQVDRQREAAEVQPLLREAGHLADQVREAIDSGAGRRTDLATDRGAVPGATANMDRLVDRALELYRHAIGQMTRVQQDELRSTELTCTALTTHAWTQCQGTSVKAVQSAAQLFAQQWQTELQPSTPTPVAHSLTREIEEVQRLLQQRTSTRSDQIAAVLNLNRRAITVAEASTTSRLPLNQFENGNSRTVLSTGPMRLFLRLASSEWGRSTQNLIDERQAGNPSKGPLVWLVSQGSSARRNGNLAPVTQPPLVDVKLRVNQPAEEAEQGSADHDRCVLWPNRRQSLELSLTNRQDQAVQLSTQIWGVTGPLSSLPSGAIDQSMAQAWLKRQPSLVPLAEAVLLSVDAQSTQAVPLVPATNAPDVKQAALACAGMLIGVTDVASQRTQIEVREFHVRHPRDLVRQQITFDEQNQCLQVQSSLPKSVNRASVVLSQRLLEWPQLNVVASGQDQLSSAAPEKLLKLSTSRSRSDRMVLLTEIDGWPAVLASAVDRVRGQLTSDVVAHVGLATALPESIVMTSSNSVPVSLTAWSNVPFASEQTEIQIGWDRNRDRTLAGEATVNVASLPSIAAMYCGIDATGAMCCESRVEARQLSMSLDGLSNQRASLLAELKQGQLVLARSDIEIIVDRQAPTIVRTQVGNGTHCLLGKPIELCVEADDQGLAGIAKVEGAWSLDGRLQLSDDMQPLTAIVRPDGMWTLTLPTVMPTATLPAGDNCVLLRAIDRAGNRSETVSLNVCLTTQQALDKLADNATSVLSGWLGYVSAPQPDLKIELLRAPSTDPKPGAADPSADRSSADTVATAKQAEMVASTTSMADGSFQLRDVRSGQYLLRVSGIVRGMRYEQSRPVSVQAPRQVPPIMWRLDKQP